MQTLYESGQSLYSALMASLNEHVRLRLIALREDRGFTQEHVAQAIGVTQSTISRFELGDAAKSDLDTVNAVAQIYGLTLAQLLSDAPATPPDPKFEALRAAYIRLHEDVRPALVAMMEAVVPKQSRPSGLARRSVKQGRTPKRAPPA